MNISICEADNIALKGCPGSIVDLIQLLIEPIQITGTGLDLLPDHRSHIIVNTRSTDDVLKDFKILEKPSADTQTQCTSFQAHGLSRVRALAGNVVMTASVDVILKLGRVFSHAFITLLNYALMWIDHG